MDSKRWPPEGHWFQLDKYTGFHLTVERETGKAIVRYRTAVITMEMHANGIELTTFSPFDGDRDRVRFIDTGMPSGSEP